MSYPFPRARLRAALLLCLLPAGLALADDPPAGLSARANGWPRVGEPVAVVVHGIDPIHADLDPLEADLVGRGFRVLRFVYDDRAHLERGAEAFAQALRDLCAATRPRYVAVVAHSMGGLVARRALTTAHGLQALPTRFRLITIAAPFGGFVSANFSWLDFGLGPRVYRSLGSWSRFIRRPGELIPSADHVKLETLEEGKRLDGEDDAKVKLRRQRRKRIDRAVRRRHVLALGHVGSVRDAQRRVPPGTRLLLWVYLGNRAPLPPGAAADPRRPAAGLGALLTGQ